MKLSGSWEEIGNSLRVFAVLVLPMLQTPVFRVNVPYMTNMMEEKNGLSLMSQKEHVQIEEIQTISEYKVKNSGEVQF